MAKIPNMLYLEYTVKYINGCMSLRQPQSRSLKILDTILDEIDLKKNQELKSSLEIVHDLYPTCINFERDFPSLTFALATGVGKTRLMGAFITYLYTQKGIKNFFVVAPNLTVYNKLKKDLGDPSSEKYVFRGIGCFAQTPPNLITGENYREKGSMQGFSDITINIFNISKFNRELGKIRNLSEYLGQSYFNFLASRDDLVVLMDESHHYRADKGMAAINDLQPVLGLELTATPQVEMGTKAVKFKNVVYEYPLSAAIRDKFTKVPYAMTRRDFSDFNLTREELDKMMLSDGILNHERVKAQLKQYAANYPEKKLVKPFVLVVCKDTEHAEEVKKYITSNDFFEGKYANKTLVVHSNQKGAEKEDNIQLLLEVEDSSNPIEIVIHVNMLKEGWDVNNLYTIIPLRTAASQTLREQTIGRGLRLPYGEQTGCKEVDSLIITAHDKFEEIVKESANPNSLLKAGNIIYAEDIESSEAISVEADYKKSVQMSLEEFGANLGTEGFTIEETKAIADVVTEASKQLIDSYRIVGKEGLSATRTRDIVDNAIEKAGLAEIVKSRTDFTDIIKRFTTTEIEKQREFIENGTMAIPQIKISRDMKSDYHFESFDLNLSEFNYYPIDNEILLQSLIDNNDNTVIEGKTLDFNALNPMKVLAEVICSKPEVDYDACSDLLYDLLSSLMDYFAERFTKEEIKNIIMFNKKDISNKIYLQMKKHFVCSTPNLIEQISGISYTIVDPNYIRKIGEAPISLYADIADSEVPKKLFTGFKKALHPIYKFDSSPEKTFAIVCERDNDAQKWLRPAPQQFNLFYGNGQRYEPDFVVETKDTMLLVEIKGEDKINSEENLQKKARAIRYCEVANVYCEAHGLKPWKYLYIPSKQVQTTSSIKVLAERFWAK